MSSNAPRISIIIPAYNVAPWLGATLRTVLAQTVSDWECLVIDDGSHDNTADLARAFGDSRIHVICQANAGVSAARNHGLSLARGRYIAFLDADDLWHSRALEFMTAPLQADPQAVLAWADFVRFEDGTCKELPLPATRLWHTGDTWADMLVDNFMQFGALCVRADAAKTFEFDTALRIGEDRDWLLRLLKGHKAVHVSHVVHYYRQRSGSAMRDTQRFLDDEEKMMQPHLQATSVSRKLRRRALASLAFHRAVLLAKVPGKRFACLQAFVQAVIADPFYCETYLRPLKKLFLTLLPAKTVRLPV